MTGILTILILYLNHLAYSHHCLRATNSDPKLLDLTLVCFLECNFISALFASTIKSVLDLFVTVSVEWCALTCDQEGYNKVGGPANTLKSFFKIKWYGFIARSSNKPIFISKLLWEHSAHPSDISCEVGRWYLFGIAPYKHSITHTVMKQQKRINQD